MAALLDRVADALIRFLFPPPPPHMEYCPDCGGSGKNGWTICTRCGGVGMIIREDAA